MGGSSPAFFFQRRRSRARSLGGWLAVPAALSLFIVAFGPGFRFFRDSTFLRRRQFHPSAPCFGKADCDGLLRRTGAVLAFPNMVYLFTYELSGLRAGRFTFPRILTRTIHGLLFWHPINSSQSKFSRLQTSLLPLRSRSISFGLHHPHLRTGVLCHPEVFLQGLLMIIDYRAHVGLVKSIARQTRQPVVKRLVFGVHRIAQRNAFPGRDMFQLVASLAVILPIRSPRFFTAWFDPLSLASTVAGA